ncbi:MAG: 1,4-alpha-glucan branching protein GlgB, partial [Clostridiales bacterium]|nr:1,4-alpha-glucan branching protein GlgB [Clostridiales bacterium]
MRYNGPTAAVRDQFHQGTNRRAYEMLGAHPVTQDGQEMWHFAVWAPNARAVSLIGEFNQWDRKKTPMQKVYDGTWEVRLPAETFDVKSDPKRYDYPDAAKKLTTYKYCIQAQDGTWQDKADPYGFAMQMRPDTASRIYDLSGYRWGDADWMEARKSYDPYHSPVNIYEMHLGSWRRHKDGTFLTYTEIAEQLVPYLKEMGYTHVEFMPVMEHPLDMSWGYQVSGYYAATARFGEPKELMALIDALHQAGIGVLLDWVPAHFPRDAMGLRRFDGTPCYEHPDPRRGDMPQWGTHMFDYARGEVNSFMLSNACFWLEWYHADGLRVDAVTSMLMYDFCREPGQWLPNKYGGHENLDAIAFLRRMNETVYRDFPGVMMVAEESTAWPLVTYPVSDGGLGFNLKWNMGWMNDMCHYLKLDPWFRQFHHKDLTFSLMYAFSENFVLPISHDEVVYMKGSLRGKMPGDEWRQLAGVRSFMVYMLTHPGKKLTFMGAELGQWHEWDFAGQLDWYLLENDANRRMQDFFRAVNRYYLTNPALWHIDFDWAGFEWLVADDNEDNTVVFVRRDGAGEELLVAVNFSPNGYRDYRFGVPPRKTWREELSTDDTAFGGTGEWRNEKPVRTQAISS